MRDQYKYPVATRKQAVQLVKESLDDYPTLWATIEAISPQIGCAPTTLRLWVKNSGVADKHNMRLSDAARRIQELEQQVRTLQRANETLRLAAALFAQAEWEQKLG